MVNFSDDVGCTMTRGATGRATNFITDADAEKERLIKDWVQFGDVAHPGAIIFTELIAGATLTYTDITLFRGRFKSDDMEPHPMPWHSNRNCSTCTSVAVSRS